MFIAFEGLDGSGSSTQSRLLSERLEKAGKPTLLTKEPTRDAPIGKLIREVLQHKWEASPEGLQLLFSADRAEHLKNEILPALQSGQIVVTDRYFFSTMAYGALEVPMDWLKELCQFFPVPDITFLFKVSPKECIKRISGRGNDFELFEKDDKLERIWANYEQIAEEYGNFHLIDATQSIEAVHEEIWKTVSKQL